MTLILPVPSKTHPATLSNITTGKTAANNGIRTEFMPQNRLLHAKTLVIDGLICWVGSGNMTAAAAGHNHEIYSRFESQKCATKIVDYWKLQGIIINEN